MERSGSLVEVMDQKGQYVVVERLPGLDRRHPLFLATWSSGLPLASIHRARFAHAMGHDPLELRAPKAHARLELGEDAPIVLRDFVYEVPCSGVALLKVRGERAETLWERGETRPLEDVLGRWTYASSRFSGLESLRTYGPTGGHTIHALGGGDAETILALTWPPRVCAPGDSLQGWLGRLGRVARVIGGGGEHEPYAHEPRRPVPEPQPLKR